MCLSLDDGEAGREAPMTPAQYRRSLLSVTVFSVFLIHIQLTVHQPSQCYSSLAYSATVV